MQYTVYIQIYNNKNIGAFLIGIQYTFLFMTIEFTRAVHILCLVIELAILSVGRYLPNFQRKATPSIDNIDIIR